VHLSLWAERQYQQKINIYKKKNRRKNRQRQMNKPTAPENDDTNRKEGYRKMQSATAY